MSGCQANCINLHSSADWLEAYLSWGSDSLSNNLMQHGYWNQGSKYKNLCRYRSLKSIECSNIVCFIINQYHMIYHISIISKFDIIYMIYIDISRYLKPFLKLWSFSSYLFVLFLVYSIPVIRVPVISVWIYHKQVHWCCSWPEAASMEEWCSWIFFCIPYYCHLLLWVWKVSRKGYSITILDCCRPKFWLL